MKSPARYLVYKGYKHINIPNTGLLPRGQASFHIYVSYENQKLPLLEMCDKDVQRLIYL